MKTAAVLMDGAYVEKSYYSLKRVQASAAEIMELARRSLDGEREELFRIYYYDCPPYDKSEIWPLSGGSADFGNSPVSRRKQELHGQLATSDFVAFRRGVLRFKGWRVAKYRIKELSQRELTEDDLEPDFIQKGVDIKIGLDVAWLASKQIVDRIILVTADSDFIPAMKFARQEGVQVVLALFGDRPPPEMAEHADIVRSLIV